MSGRIRMKYNLTSQGNDLGDAYCTIDLCKS